MSTKKKTPAKKTSSIPTLESILGIEPAVQFQFAGRVIEARRINLSEQLKLNAAISEVEDLEPQAAVIAQLLTARLVVGEEITAEEALEVLDLQTAQRLLLLLQGQFRPREDDGDEGK